MSNNRKSGLSRAAAKVREAGRALRGKNAPLSNLTGVETAAEAPLPAADQGIIVDIGMNDGTDSYYYRKRGFQVIAVEAIPDLCKAVSQKFDELGLDGIDIKNFAITDSDVDEVTFYVNKFDTEWSSVDEEIGSRAEGAEKIVVPAVDVSKLLKDVSKQIRYAKIDIEGLDNVALAQIMSLPDRPPYISVENGSSDMLQTLYENGYDRFKFSNQKYTHYQTIPPYSPHGKVFDHQFPDGASGLFGEDLEGEWLSYEDAMKVQKGLNLAAQHAPNNLFAVVIGWFDLHAKHSSAK
ncbi:FkbM family methyltransferase [Ruegeria arenilitoris]|uniref:FkbM family methyltransferase n=1 Tax=Ruegeria arenilitoris TaxID=1173585 RepID=UPI00147A3764|nr:FkbM family methyltransferase [Ruegeria arenilitoris]